MPRSKRPETAETGAERKLLEFLNRKDYRPVPQRELLHRLQVPGKDRPETRRLIRRLIDEGKVRKMRGGRLVAAREEQEVRGTLERHRGGYARVTPEAGGEEVFLAARHLADARPGDRVTVRVVARGRDGRLRGVVSHVIASERGELLGVFRQRKQGGVVHPFDSVLGRAIHVPAAYRGDAKDMHAVRFEVVRGPSVRIAREGKVLETLGHLDDPGTDTLVVARKYGLAGEFPRQVRDASSALPSTIGRKAAAGRERFDDPPPVTIDGETAQDFDDAVSVAELPRGGFRLFVHIADVSHFVEPNGALDAEARRRGTSVYFPGRVVPMFPETLSNDLCSLRPGEDRLVQSVVLDLGAGGAVRKVRFADGIIRSAARLTYKQVAAVLEGERRVRGVPARLVSMLRAADRLRSVLERRRHRRGGIDFDLPEPQILLDVEGAMTGITIEPRNRAHLMVEEFMLLANEVVAGYLGKRKAPCLYRVHEPPDPAKLATLADFVKGLGFELRTSGDEVLPGEIQALLEAVEGSPEGRVISQVTLHTMRQAKYSWRNSGHFGLAAPVYCHFTSPIRRYPDLVVHRELRRARAGTRARSGSPPAVPEKLAERCSELERSAEAAERELLAWKKVAFIESRVGEIFDGIVTGVAPFGLFVQLVDNQVEGLVRVASLGPEWFEFDASRFELRGAESGLAFRLGDRLRVRVDRVDRVLQRVDLAPVAGGTTPAPRPRRRRGCSRRVARGR
jgi:ribonuclease R